MNMVADYSEIVPDNYNIICEWICRELKLGTDWLTNYRTFGIMRNNKIIAGLIFHNARFGQDVWWTIYSTDKHWCNRRILKEFMHEAFINLKCRRINLLVDTDNESCLEFVKRLGFKIEGLLRQYRDNGKNCYILGLLKSETKYL